MEINKKKITVRQAIDAIEQNGLPKTTKTFWRFDKNGNIKSGCAIGQAAVNLGVNANDLLNSLNDVPNVFPGMVFGGANRRLGDRIVSLNDHTRKGLKGIAKTIREEYEALLGKTITVPVENYSQFFPTPDKE